MNYGKKIVVLLVLIVVVVGLAFFLTSHFKNEGEQPVVTTTSVATSDSTTLPTTETTTESLEDLKESIDTETIHPNELGEIMVLVYHRLAEENTEYDRTVESFKADLQRLYDEGYRTISMQDYINSTFDLPAGTTPILLTFDDGSISHFKVAKAADGQLKPDPNCVVGILDAFYKEHPDFGKHAIFYVNADAFQEPGYLEWKLSYLLENGYELGNHTYGHNFLNKLTGEEVQEVIGSNEQLYHGINEQVKFTSFALPYGIHPEGADEVLAMEGEYKGIPYKHEVAFLVGWRPTWPLYIEGIEKSGINRVQCGDAEFQLSWWLDVYAEDGSKRFISDGVKEIITIPEAWEQYLDKESVEEERVLVY